MNYSKSKASPFACKHGYLRCPYQRGPQLPSRPHRISQRLAQNQQSSTPPHALLGPAQPVMQPHHHPPPLQQQQQQQPHPSHFQLQQQQQQQQQSPLQHSQQLPQTQPSSQHVSQIPQTSQLLATHHPQLSQQEASLAQHRQQQQQQQQQLASSASQQQQPQQISQSQPQQQAQQHNPSTQQQQLQQQLRQHLRQQQRLRQQQQLQQLQLQQLLQVQQQQQQQQQNVASQPSGSAAAAALAQWSTSSAPAVLSTHHAAPCYLNWITLSHVPRLVMCPSQQAAFQHPTQQRVVSVNTNAQSGLPHTAQAASIPPSAGARPRSSTHAQPQTFAVQQQQSHRCTLQQQPPSQSQHTSQPQQQQQHQQQHQQHQVSSQQQQAVNGGRPSQLRRQQQQPPSQSQHTSQPQQQQQPQPQRPTQPAKKPSGGGSFPRHLADWHLPDRYEIHYLIGTGSYGNVCEAFDKEEQRAVAIKKIPRVFEDLIDCKRILREIAILNRLEHPHIVKILDIIVPKDLERFDEMYVVLEIADSDFKKLFRSSIYLSEAHIKMLLYNLLVGVKFVHSAGILHRDLKPANCLVNQDCSVRVCDFGLARTIDFGEASLVMDASNTTSSAGQPPQEDYLPDVPHNKHLKRQLTGHVVTRWYRAPELILLQENYTEAIDVWSIGCIFSELLSMIEENVESHCDRGPLFPGSSCFPLSPDQKNGSDSRIQTRGNRDQLNVIFNVLGTPSEEDIEALENDEARRYIRIFSKRNELQNIRYVVEMPLLEGSCAGLEKSWLGFSDGLRSAEALNLLKRMLVFNPKKRISVDECLAHPFFEEIRNTEIEVTAKEKVRLPFNDWANMDETQLRLCFLREMQRFHPDLVLPESLLEKARSGATRILISSPPSCSSDELAKRACRRL